MMAGHRTVHSQAMRPIPSSKEPGPSPPGYVHVGLVLIVGGVVACRVGRFGSAVFSRTADLLNTMGDREVVSRTEKYVNKTG